MLQTNLGGGGVVLIQDGVAINFNSSIRSDDRRQPAPNVSLSVSFPESLS